MNPNYSSNTNSNLNTSLKIHKKPKTWNQKFGTPTTCFLTRPCPFPTLVSHRARPCPLSFNCFPARPPSARLCFLHFPLPFFLLLPFHQPWLTRYIWPLLGFKLKWESLASKWHIGKRPWKSFLFLTVLVWVILSIWDGFKHLNIILRLKNVPIKRFSWLLLKLHGCAYY